MSDCNHNCSECNKDCSSRIEKFQTNNFSHIKHIIGVVSGKGGVGKSFVTSLLASNLNKLGFKVGILDGDVTGPSIPKSFNIHEQADGDGESLIFPAITDTGIKIISSNMLLKNEDDPIIWRGSLISNLVRQFYTDVLWEELDYLLIDMPPGTGDVTLTVFQQIPIDEIVIVTSPQDLVNMIVNKAINMAKMMNIKILGVVENMSYLVCPNCKEKIYLYGKSNIEDSITDKDIKVLAKLPIIVGNSREIDEGNVETLDVPEFKNVINELLKENSND